jgi:diacylglycerol kinase (ATP)
VSRSLTTAIVGPYVSDVRALIICNPTSGGGRAATVLPAAERRLFSAGIEVVTYLTTSLHDARTASEQAAEGYDVVVALGGDGTVGACAAGLAAASAGRAALGIVPAGGGNDTAGALGLPIHDPVAAADLLPALPRRRVDLARAGEHVYVDIAGVGFDSEVNRLANRTTWLRGRARYAWAVVAQLAVRRPARFTVELDGQRHEAGAWFVAVANGPSYGAGIRIAPDARMDDGMLDVVVVADISRRELLRTFPKAFSGRHVDHPGVTIYRAAKVGIEADPTQWVFADGEEVCQLPLVFESMPQAISVLATADAPALTPPADTAPGA